MPIRLKIVSVLALLAASLAWSTSPAQAQSQAQRPAKASVADPARLLRTALIVEDVDRAQRFYGLLGYAPESSMGGSRDPATTPFPLNAPAKSWRLVILASPANPGARIGLVSFDDPRPTASRASRRKAGLGDIVLVFDVADAWQVHERLKAAAADIIETPQPYQSKQLDARGQPMRGHVFHVFDPDGYLIELLEAPKPVAD